LASHEYDGIRYIDLSTLIELKLASGMTNAARLRDLGDVLELIRLLGLTEAFGEELDPFVREKYRELWTAARPASLSAAEGPGLPLIQQRPPAASMKRWRKDSIWKLEKVESFSSRTTRTWRTDGA
jgi:hypothetical protein